MLRKGSSRSSADNNSHEDDWGREREEGRGGGRDHATVAATPITALAPAVLIIPAINADLDTQGGCSASPFPVGVDISSPA